MSPTKFFLYPYKSNSSSCKKLAKELNAKLIKLKNSAYKNKPNHLVINWGNSNPPDYISLNKTTTDASNKLRTFQKLQEHDLPIPEWTTDKEKAKTWLPKTVFARTVLNGHSGKGIIEFTGEQDAPLYVKYIKKTFEYRFHTTKNAVLDIQQKKRKFNHNLDYKIRNLANGWIYARNDINQPNPIASELAMKAIQALNLDFGAVDIIYNQHQNKYYILEVNTAPGLENTTLTKYKEYFQNV